MMHLLWGKKIAHRPAADTQKGTPGESLEEAGDNDGLDILRHRAWDDENRKGCKGCQINWPPPVKLTQRTPDGAQRNTQHKHGQAQRRHETTAPKLGVHLRVAARVDGAGARHAKRPRRCQRHNEPLARRRPAARTPRVGISAVKAHIERVGGLFAPLGFRVVAPRGR